VATVLRKSFPPNAPIVMHASHVSTKAQMKLIASLFLLAHFATRQTLICLLPVGARQCCGNHHVRSLRTCCPFPNWLRHANCSQVRNAWVFTRWVQSTR